MTRAMSVDIEVPIINNTPLGPIHSLACDGRGRVYLSDEINHRVVCLTELGALLWWRGADSSNAIQLKYPRGLALGKIIVGAERIECLAVCDSWNNRIIFFNYEGEKISECISAGGQALKEVSDIRYIAGGEVDAETVENKRGAWLLVDRGNHRLCWLSEEGKLTDQVGKQCIPWVQEHFRNSDLNGLMRELGAQKPKPFPPLNFLYYPSRLLEGDGRCLAVEEPLRGTVKLLHHNYLLAVPLPQNKYQWVTFTNCGLWGWDRENQILAFVDFCGVERERITDIGVPVVAEPVYHRLWAQRGQNIICRGIPHDNPDRGDETISVQPASILETLADAELHLLDQSGLESRIDEYLLGIKKLLEMADSVIADLQRSRDMDRSGDVSIFVLDATLEELQHKKAAVQREVENFCTTLAKWAFAGVRVDFRSGDQKRTAERTRRCIEGVFVSLAEMLDRIVMAGVDHSAGNNVEIGDARDLVEIRCKIDAALWPLGKYLEECFSALQIAEGKATNLEEDAASRMIQGDGRKVDACAAASAAQPFPLSETEYWTIGEECKPYGRPQCLAISPEGKISVAFSASSDVFEFDQKGQLLRALSVPSIQSNNSGGPNGISWDENGRLWLAYGHSGVVAIWDPIKKSLQTIERRFKRPFCICKGGSGGMVVLDYDDHRVSRLSSDGSCTWCIGGRGKEPGKFIHPFALFAGHEGCGELESQIFVVDHRNHRIQRFQMSGEFVSELGGCGLADGKMALPLTGAIFPDGTLAVSMWHLARCLMLVSPSGEELGRIPIDYVPGDMFVMGNRLGVLDGDGNRIRIYQRFYYCH